MQKANKRMQQIKSQQRKIKKAAAKRDKVSTFSHWVRRNEGDPMSRKLCTRWRRDREHEEYLLRSKGGFTRIAHI